MTIQPNIDVKAAEQMNVFLGGLTAPNACSKLANTKTAITPDYEHYNHHCEPIRNLPPLNDVIVGFNTAGRPTDCLPAETPGTNGSVSYASPAETDATTPDIHTPLWKDVAAFIGLILLIPSMYFVLLVTCAAFGEIQ